MTTGFPTPAPPPSPRPRLAPDGFPIGHRSPKRDKTIILKKRHNKPWRSTHHHHTTGIAFLLPVSPRRACFLNLAPNRRLCFLCTRLSFETIHYRCYKHNAVTLSTRSTATRRSQLNRPSFQRLDSRTIVPSRVSGTTYSLSLCPPTPPPSSKEHQLSWPTHAWQHIARIYPPRPIIESRDRTTIHELGRPTLIELLSPPPRLAFPAILPRHDAPSSQPLRAQRYHQ